MLPQLRVNFSNNSSLGAEQQRGEKAPQQVRYNAPNMAFEAFFTVACQGPPVTL